MSAIDLREVFLHMKDDLSVDPVPVDEAFWAEIGQRTHLHDGRLAMVCAMDRTWPHWERHPAGDEIVLLLSGAMDLVLEEPGGERTAALRPGLAVVVPRGVWHRGIVRAPGAALFVTPGRGTEHRPVEPQEPA